MDGSRDDSRRADRRGKKPRLRVGATASVGGLRLRSFRVGAVPIINHYFQRLRLDQLLAEHLPPDDSRQLIPTRRVVLLLVRNVLLSREPLYAVPEWVADHAPDLFDLYHVDVSSLQDDRLGVCLARLFTATTPQLLLAIVRSAIDRFNVSLDEMHNDSTTASFYGKYLAARLPIARKGRLRPAINWGNSKARRPDLKQLLFTLTLANDGGVPLYFHVDSGNTTDDVTHRRSWDLLVELAGTVKFLYVADCKLASRENLHYISARGGRFVTVLPATRREDGEFRRRLREDPRRVAWLPCWTRVEEPDDPCRRRRTAAEPDDVFRVREQEELTSDGYRLLWYHSRRKAEFDETARGERCQRVFQELRELQDRLRSPRTRFRTRSAVESAVQDVLSRRGIESLLRVEITEEEEETFRKVGRGRPSQNSKYRRDVRIRFGLTWRLDDQAWEEARLDDGVFPLLTNDRELSPREVLQAYKRQPKIEKRFTQLKSDLNLTPVFLKSPERIVGLFTIYFLALLVQSLIERDLRNALTESAAKAPARDKRWDGSVEVYPEGRRTRRPTARHALDLFEGVRRHEILQTGQGRNDEPLTLHDDLTTAQSRLLRLLGIDPKTYGR